MQGTDVVVVPRNFKLLDEMEKKEKGGGDGNISFGLENPEDIMMTTWNATIFPPSNTKFGNEIYTLRVVCNDKYPIEPPEIYFVTKINLTIVDHNTGKVNLGSPSASKTFDWANERNQNGIERCLLFIRNEMLSSANKRLEQPQPGQTW